MPVVRSRLSCAVSALDGTRRQKYTVAAAFEHRISEAVIAEVMVKIGRVNDPAQHIYFRFRLNRLVLEPREGQLWQADHIIPVAEGGGEASLDNFRTLCVPCHELVTKKVHAGTSFELGISRIRHNNPRTPQGKVSGIFGELLKAATTFGTFSNFRTHSAQICTSNCS